VFIRVIRGQKTKTNKQTINKMRRILLSLAAILIGGVSLQAQQLAFPGAEGFGKYSVGARGAASPSVYHVTNLNDSGSGSFRDAVSQSGRIVVFDVCGIIRLSSRVVCSGNSYIAGHTAPGDGIILYGNGISFSGCNNLIVRHLRVYMGKGGESGKDAAGIANGVNMIFDHLSIAWGQDENFSVNWDSKGSEPGNITIQNSIIGQGLMTHSAGGLIQTNGGVSIIGCLYIDNSTRNPKVKGVNQFINNVVYNWAGSDGYILADSDGPSWAWMEGNYFISGPNSGASPFTRARTNFQLYTNSNSNYVDGNKNGSLDGTATTDVSYANNNAGGAPTIVSSPSAFTSCPLTHPAIDGAILSPQDALTQAITSAGANLPARSAVDVFLVEQLQSWGSRGELITNETQNGIYNNVGTVSQGVKPADTDNDGIPDAWEEANGLNKSSAADATTVASNGYLNIENYINSITAPVSSYVRSASNLKMTERTKESVRLEWVNNAESSDGLVLEYSTDGTTWATVQTLPADATACNVACLAVESPYYFRLITTKTGQANSSPSEELRIVTEGDPKAPYASISPAPAIGGTSRFYTSVDFAWQNETGPWAGDVSYNISFGTSATNLSQLNSTPLTALAYTYTPVTPLTMEATYYWRVDATNLLGTTLGTVWSFTAGTYSFVSSFVDLGKDFDGTNTVNAKSGALIVSGTTSYTVFSGSANEMKFAISGGTVTQGDGIYMAKGTTAIQHFYCTSEAHYIEVTLTTPSAAKNIASIKINGTGSDVDEAKGSVHAAVLFSDKVPFDGTSLIGYEIVDLPQARAGIVGVTTPAPVGSKSFRIYPKGVTISSTGEDSYQIGGTTNAQKVGSAGANGGIAYIAATLELLSNDGNATPPPASDNNRLLSLTVNGASFALDHTAGTASYTFPKATGALGTWVVTYTLPAGATASFTSGATHNFAAGNLSIEVTAENGDKKTYTVSATVSNKVTVALLTADGNKAAYDDLLVSAFSEYDIKYINAGGTAPASIADLYAGCDLIVLHSNVGGTNAIAVATRALVGQKPILNLKAYFYNDGRWSWGTPANGAVGDVSVTVDAALQNHPIFTGVSFEGNTLTYYSSPTNVINGIQSLTAQSGTNWTAALIAANHVLAKHGDNVQLHEVNLSVAAKYLLLGLSMEGSPSSYTLFNANTIAILRNAAAYLISPYIYYDYTGNVPVEASGEQAKDELIVPCVVPDAVPSGNDTIASLSVKGVPAQIDQTTGTITCAMPEEVHDYGTWAVTFTLAHNKARASITNGSTHAFTENVPLSIVVTAENGNTKTYALTVTVTPYVPSTVNTLATLSVNGVEAQIDQTTGEIVCTMPEGVTDYDTWAITYTLTDNRATADISNGANRLFSKGSTLYIVVSSETGDEKIYSLTVNLYVAPTDPNDPNDPPLAIGKETESGLFYADGLLHNPRLLYLTIYNVQGTALLQSGEATISVEHLPQGIYVAKPKKAGALKFVKQ
jgi:hypothetical protein